MEWSASQQLRDTTRFSSDPQLAPTLARFPIGDIIPLNASSSAFADRHFWNFLQYTGATPPAFIEGINESKTSFASSGGTYQVLLSVSNNFAGYNEIIRPFVFLRDPQILKKIVFDNPANPGDDIYGILTQVLQSTSGSNLSCIHCHSKRGIPGDARGIFELVDPTVNVSGYQEFLAYDRMLTRIDCDNPQNSLILKKPAGEHHGGGAVAGFAEGSGLNSISSGDDNNRAAILRWIIAGAPRYGNGNPGDLGCER